MIFVIVREKGLLVIVVGCLIIKVKDLVKVYEVVRFEWEGIKL